MKLKRALPVLCAALLLTCGFAPLPPQAALAGGPGWILAQTETSTATNPPPPDTNTPTPTSTNTSTATATGTNTSTPTATSTATNTSPASDTDTPTPTETGAPGITSTPSPSETTTSTPTATPPVVTTTVGPSPTRTKTATITPTRTATRTPTITPTPGITFQPAPPLPITTLGFPTLTASVPVTPSPTIDLSQFETPIVPSAVRMSSFRILDSSGSDVTSFPLVLHQPYFLEVSLTNEGMQPFTPFTSGRPYQIRVTLQGANGEILEEKVFIRGVSMTLEDLRPLQPGETQVLRTEGLHFFHPDDGSVLFVSFEPPPEMRLDNSSLSTSLIFRSGMSEYCVCTGITIQEMMTVAAEVSGRPWVANGQFGSGLASWGCNQEPEAVVEAAATWFVEQIFTAGIASDIDLYTAGLDVANRMATVPDMCLSYTGWLAAFAEQINHAGHPANLILTESPVLPRVVDGQGNWTGFDLDGTMTEGLPGSRAVAIGEKRVVLFSGAAPVDVQVTGFDVGTMNLLAVFAAADQRVWTLRFDFVEVVPGMLAYLPSTVDRSTVLLIDDNGDGQPDRRIAPAVIEGVQTGTQEPRSNLTVFLVAVATVMIALLILAALGGAGYWFWRYRKAKQEEDEDESLLYEKAVLKATSRKRPIPPKQTPPEDE